MADKEWKDWRKGGAADWRSEPRLSTRKEDKEDAVKSTVRDHAHEETVQFPSGATMSRLDARYDLICPEGLRRLAERYALGAKKHGDTNWCQAGEDKAFQRARLNHLIRHLADYLREGNSRDDNLAAIAWAAFALMHYEDKCRHHEQILP